MNMILKTAMAGKRKAARKKSGDYQPKKLRGAHASLNNEVNTAVSGQMGRQAVGEVLAAHATSDAKAARGSKKAVGAVLADRAKPPSKPEPPPARAPKPGDQTPARAPKPPTKPSGDGGGRHTTSNSVGPATKAFTGRHALAAGGLLVGAVGTGLAYRHYKKKRKAEDEQ